MKLADEHDVETLRQISLLLDRENQRLIAKNLELTAELARLRGIPDVQQLTFSVQHELHQARTYIFQREDGHAAAARAPRRPQPGHGPREQPTLPIVDIRHELAQDQRQCPACGGELAEMAGQCETSERITTVKLTYQVEHHVRQKYRCACNGAVVTAPGPAQLIPGGRYAPEFAVGVAVAKYADHLPLERQVRMMAREGLRVDSQTLWDQIQALARHLEPTYEALGARARAAPVINVDETRWPRLGSSSPSAGTVWGVHAPAVSFYRILPGKSTDEGRQVLGGYRGTVVVDGFAVYEVLARDGPGFTSRTAGRTPSANTTRSPTTGRRRVPRSRYSFGSCTLLSASCPGRFQATPLRRRFVSSCGRSGRARSSIGSGSGPPCRSAYHAATSARPYDTCSNAGRA